MSNTDSLGQRMKQYESVSKTKLTCRTPVAIRIDGKAFHTFTRGMYKPFDPIFIKTMQDTMRYLCRNIPGCVCGYSQSDEITLILIDYQKLNTAAWFNNNVQKICSISASIATMAFNEFYRENVENIYYNTEVAMTIEEERKWFDLYSSKYGKAMFDSRCFNIPKEEVTNLLYWRQLDAIRNSILSVGQVCFGHSEIKYWSCNKIKNELLKRKNIDWENLPILHQRGSCCVKKDGVWTIDNEIPIFKDEGREYIEILVDI